MSVCTTGVSTRNCSYGFSVVPSAVTEDAKGRLIRLDNLDLSLHGPGDRLIRLDNLDLSLHGPGDRVAAIHTEITVREGQRVVVGKSNMGTDQSLILVVTAKVTE